MLRLLIIALVSGELLAQKNWHVTQHNNYPFIVQLRLDPDSRTHSRNCSGVLIDRSGVLTDYFCTVFYREMVVCAGVDLVDCKEVTGVERTETDDLMYLRVAGRFVEDEFVKVIDVNAHLRKGFVLDKHAACVDVGFSVNPVDENDNTPFDIPVLFSGPVGEVSCCNRHAGRFCNRYDSELVEKTDCPLEPGGALVCNDVHVIGIRLSNCLCTNLIYGSVFRPGKFKIKYEDKYDKLDRWL